MARELGTGGVWSDPDITIVHFGNIEGYMDIQEQREAEQQEPPVVQKRRKWYQWW